MSDATPAKHGFSAESAHESSERTDASVGIPLQTQPGPSSEADLQWLARVRARAESVRRRREGKAGEPGDSAVIDASWLQRVRERAEDLRRCREAMAKAAMEAIQACDAALSVLRRSDEPST